MQNKLDFYLQQKYKLVITEDDDGSYYAEYPDLKGCMSVGESIEDVTYSIQDAKTAWLETALENNIDIPLPKSEDDYSGSFRLRIPKSLHKALADEAKQEGISMNQYCLYLLSKEHQKENCSS
ncbi:type II toxin-antitoxin system HicB family antitoxin [Acidaminobacter sp. JC074]|uniref:type II toxin-antitoxin system HicB family antitoxin n=1 Tax=Acidaminobacter sp. JC074 TaxID=2530199 RepID=UPI001F114380|nr:type II toxin-antitoxin system HicB family antitoxin [Acidaminobacter sp. JC074]MCH4890672.1 type II toxin-antitoxin system HicB family antitoxin [Acidaminobacter sp. JC074]